MAKRIKSISWLHWIVGINIFFLIATALNPFLPEAIKQIINNHLDLGVEMNFASWWAALNLLALALLAYELFSTRVGRTRIAWLILALIFAGLSLDEIGSFHERVGSMKLLLLGAAAGGVPLLYAVGILYRDRQGRGAAVKILIAFLLFGSVFLQEYLEHNLSWPAWSAGIRVGIEEGTELGAMLLLLTVLVDQRRPGTNTLAAVIPDPLKMQFLLPVVGAGLALNTLLSPLAAGFLDLTERGNPAVWYPLSMLFLLFCASVWKASRTAGEKRSLWLLLAACALLFSLASVYLISPRQEGSRFNQLGLLSNYYFQYACQLVILALIYWRMNDWELKRSMVVWLLPVLSLLLGVMIDDLTFRFVTGGLFACFVVGIFLFEQQQEKALELAKR